MHWTDDDSTEQRLPGLIGRRRAEAELRAEGFFDSGLADWLDPASPHYDAELAHGLKTFMAEREARLAAEAAAAQQIQERKDAASAKTTSVPPWARIWPPDTELADLIEQLRAEGVSPREIGLAAVAQGRWSQVEIGAALGVNQASVSHWRRGLQVRAAADPALLEQLPDILKSGHWASRSAQRRRAREARALAKLAKESAS